MPFDIHESHFWFSKEKLDGFECDLIEGRIPEKNEENKIKKTLKYIRKSLKEEKYQLLRKISKPYFSKELIESLNKQHKIKEYLGFKLINLNKTKKIPMVFVRCENDIFLGIASLNCIPIHANELKKEYNNE